MTTSAFQPLRSERSISLHCFEDDTDRAGATAKALSVPYGALKLHVFPDGESLVTAEHAAGTAVLYRALDRPNGKLVETMLGADALREAGAKRVILAAPYLPYMRQDMAFLPGQAVSQRVLARMLGTAFDAVVAVAPHLHRVSDMEGVFLGKVARAVQPTGPIAEVLRNEPDPTRVLIGPDVESAPLIRELAAALAVPCGLAAKERHGDRAVQVTLDADVDLRGRNVVIVDDIASSGATLIAVARAALRSGAGQIQAIVCHALFDLPSQQQMEAAGIAQIRSCDGVRHRTNRIALAAAIASGVLAAADELDARGGLSA